MARPSSTSSTDPPADPGARPGLLEVGTIVRPHGLRGECIVSLVTNRLERMRPGTRLVLAEPASRSAMPPAPPRSPSSGSDRRLLEVVAARPHQGRYIVSFAGYDDRGAAESLRDAVLLAEPIEGEPEAWFVHELIGCELHALDGGLVGTVTSVEANPASDLLVIDGRHLVPLRFVVERAPGRLVAELPEGLIV